MPFLNFAVTKISIVICSLLDPRAGSTFPKCRSQDPDPDSRQNEMDPKRWIKLYKY